MYIIILTGFVLHIYVSPLYSNQLIQVQMSKFIFHISLWFQAAEISHLKLLGRGSFGSAYQIREQQVIKLIYLNKKDKKITIHKALQEYCIYKIASSLKLGPKLAQSFGYDVVFFEDCLMFSMQKCEFPQSVQQQALLHDLKYLHSLKIIHYDIKPDNILFSKTYNKNVFIDFGCSQVIEQDIGFKTLTNFKGTPRYCSPQMKILRDDRTEGYVDLYYNDIFGLQKTIRQSPQCFEKIQLLQSQYKDKQQLTQNLFNHLKIRRLIFNRQLEQIQLLLDQSQTLLLPSIKIMQKMSIPMNEMNLKQKEYYHDIYNSIIENILQTYRVAKNSLLSVRQKSTFKKIENALQKYIMRSQVQEALFPMKNIKQKFKMMRIIDNYNQIQCKRQSYCLFRVLYLRAMNSQKNQVSILRQYFLLSQMSKSNISNRQFKKYFLELVQIARNKQILHLSLQIFEKRYFLSFLYKNSLFQNITLAQSLMNYYQIKKRKLWKGVKLTREANSQSFLQKIILEICFIHQVMTTPFQKNQNCLFIDIGKLLCFQNELVDIDYALKSSKFLQKIINRLIQIFKKRCCKYLDFLAIKADVIKCVLSSSKKYHKSKVTISYMFNWIKQLQNIIVNDESLDGLQAPSKRKYQSTSLRQGYYFQLYMNRLQYSKDEIKNRCLKIKQIQLSEITYIRNIQENFFSQLANLNQSNIKKGLITYFNEFCQQYFCKIDLKQFNLNFSQTVISLLNTQSIKLMLSQSSVYQSSCLIYEKWVKKQIQQGFLCLDCILCILKYMQKYNKKDQMYKFTQKIIDLFCLYKFISDNMEMKKLLILLQIKLKLEYQFRNTIKESTLVNIVVDKLKQCWIRTLRQNQIIKYILFKQKRFRDIFQLWDSMARFYTQNQDQIKTFAYFVSIHQFKFQSKNKLEQHQIEYFKQYRNFLQIYCLSQNYSNLTCIKILFHANLILSVLLRLQKHQQNLMLLHKIIELSVLSFLKKQQYCPESMKMMTRRKLLQILMRIFCSKYEYQQINIFARLQIFEFNKFLKNNWFKMNLIVYRICFCRNKCNKLTLFAKLQKNNRIKHKIREKLNILVDRIKFARKQQSNNQMYFVWQQIVGYF